VRYCFEGSKSIWKSNKQMLWSSEKCRSVFSGVFVVAAVVQNVRNYLLNDTSSHPRRPESASLL
jgi:hypothetical protein